MKIPWAIDTKTGDWLRADRAEYRGERGRYRCADKHCDRELTVARSKRGRQHFKHFRNSHAGKCAFGHHGTSVHQKAIQLLAIRFTEQLPGMYRCRYSCFQRQADLAWFSHLFEPAVSLRNGPVRILDVGLIWRYSTGRENLCC